jgi:FixJ family two-component response regulator
MPDTATVFIVDDDPAVQRALAIVGKSLGYPVKTFGLASDFLYGYEEGTPGALILDVRMPEMTGLELQKMLADAHILLPVIVVSGHADVRMAVEAMSRGAFTFMEKPFRMPELQKCIQSAVEKSIEDQAKLIREQGLRARLASLTAKEQEVLDLLLDGRSNKEIAAQLKISVRAVEDRRSRLMKRMGVASALELVGEVRSLDAAH